MLSGKTWPNFILYSQLEGVTQISGLWYSNTPNDVNSVITEVTDTEEETWIPHKKSRIIILIMRLFCAFNIR